ncbi:MAG: LytTR family DNA-binding domain-containing protein [Lachnospiraceae bacterium]|nr:LytTR family DNA-binding domain-containing protein [Lachnospiraceae bacterium]
MYQFALCDDEPADLAYVRDRIWRWAKRQCVEVNIREFPSAESFLFAYEEEKNFDVLFLDIEMGKINGVELAKKIRERDKCIQIVFVTGYMEYISEGYDVEALHYLLKPLEEEKLELVLQRAVERIGIQERALFLQNAGETVRIPFHEIRWVEVRKNYVTLHGQEEYSRKCPLHEIQKELDQRFFQTHRSYVANLSYVNKITKSNVILKDGTVLPLARGLYEKMNQAFIHYF